MVAMEWDVGIIKESPMCRKDFFGHDACIQACPLAWLGGGTSKSLGFSNLGEVKVQACVGGSIMGGSGRWGRNSNHGIMLVSPLYVLLGGAQRPPSGRPTE